MLAALRIAELLLWLPAFFFAFRALRRFHRRHGSFELLLQAMLWRNTPESLWRDPDTWRMVACVAASLACAIMADLIA